jgi:hypothetical protein
MPVLEFDVENQIGIKIIFGVAYNAGQVVAK